MSLVTDLTALRQAANLPQAKLADNAGVNRLTVQRMENGADPRLSTVQALARALGMDVMLVPRELRPELENFIRAGGRLLGQPAGVDAPQSVVDLLKAASAQPVIGRAAHTKSVGALAESGLLRVSSAQPAPATPGASPDEGFLARSQDPRRPDAP